MITAAQIRAARSLLGWAQKDLAEKCGLSQTGLANIEREAAMPRAKTMERIRDALEGAGIEFVGPGEGREGVLKRDR